MSQAPLSSVENEASLDPAQQSLSDALRTSFFILKVAMAVMALLYLFSGIFTVAPQDKAVRLMFGAVVSDASGAPREYEPGTYWGWPFPIERVVRMPVEAREVSVDRAFLPKLTEDERKALSKDEIAQNHPSLDPTKDGSLITADANLIHAACKGQWQVQGIKNFLTRVGDRDKGDLLVRAALERGLVHAVAKMQSDQALYANESLGKRVLREAQLALPENCGIALQKVEFLSEGVFAPLPVRRAFAQVSAARSEQDKLMNEAAQYAARALGDAAGPAQNALRNLISLEEIASLREGPGHALTLAIQDELARSFEQLMMAGPVLDEPASAYMHAVSSGASADVLAAARTKLQTALAETAAQSFARTGPRIEGRTRTLMAESEAYRTASLQALYAEAAAFEAQWAQFQKNPLIFKTRRWQTAREKVFTSPTVETFFVPTARLSIETGRDPETAGKVDDLLLEDRKKRAGVE